LSQALALVAQHLPPLEQVRPSSGAPVCCVPVLPCVLCDAQASPAAQPRVSGYAFKQLPAACG